MVNAHVPDLRILKGEITVQYAVTYGTVNPADIPQPSELSQAVGADKIRSATIINDISQMLKN